MVFDNTPEPLAAFPCIRAHNPEEWRHAIKLLLPCSKNDVTPTDNFCAFVNMTQLGRITLSGMGNLAKFSHEYTHGSNDVLVNLLLCGHITVKLHKNELCFKENGLNIVYQKDTPMYISADNAKSVHCIFNNDIFVDFVNTVHEGDRTALDLKSNVYSGVHNSYFQQALCETVKSIDLLPDIIQQPMIASQYEQLLLLSFLVSCPHILNLVVAGAPPASAKSVRLVEEYLDANIDQPVRLEDLAAVTGQSVRTIQEAFKKYRGYSPSSYLRECRLAKARKILQESPPDTSIVSVALACGFASHGHFSYCYKNRFGETPLHTLKKTQP